MNRTNLPVASNIIHKRMYFERRMLRRDHALFVEEKFSMVADLMTRAMNLFERIWFKR